MAGYLPAFDVVRITAQGFRVPVTTGSVILYNVTAGSTPPESPRAIASTGIVAQGSITGTVGDVIRISHATYPETCHFVLTATQDEAYTTPDNPVITYIAENLSSTGTATVGEAFLVDTNNRTVAPVRLGNVRAGTTTQFPLIATRATNYEVKIVTIDENKKTGGYDLLNAETAAITVPATGASSSLATTTELLTGTEAVKVVTPDVMAALWEKGTDIASASTISVGEGGYFNVTGTTTITDIDFATDKSGRRIWVKFDGSLTLTHSATLILPTGANITTAASDTAEFVSEGSDIVRCVSYQRANGTALVGGTEATTTETLTGTATGKFISPDILAALWEQGSNIASASTISVGEGGAFSITGTTTITDIDFATDKAGRTVWLKFDGALTLTHHATTLILPGGSNITTAAGDIAVFKSEGSDAVRLMHYQRAANFPRTQKEVYLEEYGHTNAGLAAAITAISTTATRLVVTENVTLSANHTIPATCVLSIKNNAVITVGSSSTLTIGKFEDPGNVQCFSGVSASNHVVFSAGAVPKINLAWYMGMGSTSDCSYAITDIITSVTNATSGTMFVPAGNWKVKDLTVPDGFNFEGVGCGIDSGGSRFIPADSGTAYLFRAYRNFRNITASGVAFDLQGNTTTHGFRIEGTAGYSGFGLSFTNCVFRVDGAVAASSYPLLNTSTDQQYEIIRNIFVNCHFVGANDSKCVYINSVNTMFTFLGCSFQVGSGDSFGIDAYNAGLYVGANTDFRGASNNAFDDDAATITTLTCSISSGTATLTTTGAFTQAMIGQRVYHASALPSDRYIKSIESATSATLSGNASATISGQSVTVYKWGDNPARSGCAIRVASGALLTSTIDSCADEGFNYFLRILGGSLDTPVRLTNCKVQSKIYAENSAVIYASGNEFYSNVWGVAASQIVHVYGNNTYWDNTVEMSLTNPIAKAKPWGPERAGSFYTHDEGYMSNATGGHPADRTRYWQQILEGSNANLTTPLLDVLTTYEAVASDKQYLQRWGVADANSEAFKYGTILSRLVQDPYAGYFLLDFTQDSPYKGLILNGAIGYHSDRRGTVTQATSRTTGVTCNALHGIITCYTYASTVLAPGETISFTLNNSLIQSSDFFHVSIIDNATSQYTKAWASDWGGGVATISIKNDHLSNNENASALKLAFYIFKNGGQLGISI